METTTDDLFLPLNALLPEPMIETSSTSYWKGVKQRFKQSRVGPYGLGLLLILLSFMMIAPWISGYTYQEIHLSSANQSPSGEFWFGTDDLGRDLFTRIGYGARISLFVGMTAACIDLLMGVLWGGVAGLAGGRIDEVLMRVADILYALPYLLVVIILSVVLGNGILSIIAAITLMGWMTMARIVRGQVLLLKEMDYVLAARALGASFWHILFKHLLPNSLGPILVTLTLSIPSAIFAEAFLSFLGLGVQAPMASWGTMANEGLPALSYYPWRLFFPAVFISLTMFAFHLLGEGLKQAFSQHSERI